MNGRKYDMFLGNNIDIVKQYSMSEWENMIVSWTFSVFVLVNVLV